MTVNELCEILKNYDGKQEVLIDGGEKKICLKPIDDVYKFSGIASDYPVILVQN